MEIYQLTPERVKQIRSELQGKFPGYKFSVRSDFARRVIPVLKVWLLESDLVFSSANYSRSGWKVKYFPFFPEGKQENSSVLRAMWDIISLGQTDDGPPDYIPNFYAFLYIGSEEKRHVTIKL